MLNDDRLLFAVKNALERDLDSNIFDIDVSVKDGVVILEGVVDVLGDKNFAEKRVKEVPGVKDVVNHLTIGIERKVRDAEIEEGVEKSLLEKNESFKKIGIVARKGIVHLYGEADNLAEEREIMAAAAEVQGVKEVINHMNLKKYRDGLVLDDVTIHNNVRVELSTDNSVSRGYIEVDVKNGRVTLDGIVESLEDVEMAEKLAMRARGVKSVVNRLKARQGGTGGDDALAAEIMHALGEDERVSPAQIRIYIADGTIYLGGTVDSPDAKKAAIEVIKQVAQRWRDVKGIQVGISVSGAKGSVQRRIEH